jgi:hypothetical protein
MKTLLHSSSAFHPPRLPRTLQSGRGRGLADIARHVIDTQLLICTTPIHKKTNAQKSFLMTRWAMFARTSSYSSPRLQMSRDSITEVQNAC